MTLNALSMTKQPPPPLSLLESLMKAMPIGPFSNGVSPVSNVAHQETEVLLGRDQVGSTQSVRSGDVEPKSLEGSEAVDSGLPEGSITEDAGLPEYPNFPEGGVGDRGESSGSEESLAAP